MKETEGISVDKFVDYAIMCMRDFTILKQFAVLPAPGAGIHHFGCCCAFSCFSGRSAPERRGKGAFTGSSCHIVSGVVWAWFFPCGSGGGAGLKCSVADDRLYNKIFSQKEKRYEKIPCNAAGSDDGSVPLRLRLQARCRGACC